MDSFGSLVDKLCSVDLKMWNNQELLYEIRRMSFEEYKAKYFETEDGAKLLWDTLKKACDLNIQRNAAIDALDQKIIDIVKAGVAGEDLENGIFLQKKHKTY